MDRKIHCRSLQGGEQRQLSCHVMGRWQIAPAFRRRPRRQESCTYNLGEYNDTFSRRCGCPKNGRMRNITSEEAHRLPGISELSWPLEAPCQWDGPWDMIYRHPTGRMASVVLANSPVVGMTSSSPRQESSVADAPPLRIVFMMPLM